MASAIGDTAIAVQANLAAGEAEKLTEAALAKWGQLDMLVNNAGTTKFANHEDLDALSADDFLEIYRLNVVAAYEMIRACAPAMRDAGGGSVVNVASIAGTHGIGSSVAYAASKGAMITMTKSLARALAPEIRVNAICPGYVGTGWFADRLGEDGLKAMNEAVASKVPLGIAGQAEDIADGILMFLDDASRLVTGETLVARRRIASRSADCRAVPDRRFNPMQYRQLGSSDLRSLGNLARHLADHRGGYRKGSGGCLYRSLLRSRDQLHRYRQWLWPGRIGNRDRRSVEGSAAG